MTTEIKQVANCGVNTQESLTLANRLKSSECRTTQPPLPNYPVRLMRKLGTIISLLRRILNSLRDQFTMGNTATSQLVRHYFPRHAIMVPNQSTEEAFGSSSVSAWQYPPPLYSLA